MRVLGMLVLRWVFHLECGLYWLGGVLGRSDTGADGGSGPQAVANVTDATRSRGEVTGPAKRELVRSASDGQVGFLGCAPYELK
jgi:hypothetical protein